MPFATYVTFKNLESSPALEERIVELANKLEPLAHISRCDVAVELPHRHHHKGRPFHVRIQLQIASGKEIVVSHDPGDDETHIDPYVTVRDAFDSARRQVQTFMDKLRVEQKARDAVVV